MGSAEEMWAHDLSRLKLNRSGHSVFLGCLDFFICTPQTELWSYNEYVAEFRLYSQLLVCY